MSDSQIALTSMKATIAADGAAYYYNGSSLQYVGPKTTNISATISNPNDTDRTSVSAYDNTVNYFWDSFVSTTYMYGAIEVNYKRIPTGETYKFNDTYTLFYAQ